MRDRLDNHSLHSFLTLWVSEAHLCLPFHFDRWGGGCHWKPWRQCYIQIPPRQYVEMLIKTGLGVSPGRLNCVVSLQREMSVFQVKWLLLGTSIKHFFFPVPIVSFSPSFFSSLFVSPSSSFCFAFELPTSWDFLRTTHIPVLRDIYLASQAAS